MDSQHRHDLHDNDLQEFLFHFNEWWDKYGTRVLVGVLVVVLAVTAYRFYNAHVESQNEETWSDLASTTSPEVYKQVAMSDNPTIRALSNLRGADLLMAKATRPEEITAPGAATRPANEADVTKWITEAAAMYQAVVNDAAVHEVYRLNAMLGLGSIAEAKGDWTGAKQQYESVKKAAGDKFPLLAAQATARLNMLGELSEPVAFGVEAPPTPPMFSLPASTQSSPLPGLGTTTTTAPAPGTETGTGGAPAAR